MLAVDYLIVNEDRHFNNLGALRDADTLEWIGLAPVFDCGTSLWHDRPTAMVCPLGKSPSKTFLSSHDEQIRLTGDFGWHGMAVLEGTDEVFSDILVGSPFADDVRRNAL
jgi:hypothetical protein